MVKLCPSELCKHENPDKNNYCEKCGIDLSQDKMEVKGRDELFRLFKSIDPPKTFTEEQKKMFEILSRKDFDWAIEKNVGKIYMMLINAYADNLKKINELESNAKEAKITDLEKERLEVLKEISKNLNSNRKKQYMIEYPKSGLYSIFLDRLKELKPNSSGTIRFPVVFEKLCASFQITKKQCWDILFMFRDFGLIEIIKGQGIKVSS